MVNITHKVAKIAVFISSNRTYICPVKLLKLEIMKKRIKNIVYIVAIVASMMSYANTSTSFKKERVKTVLTLSDVKKGHELLIKDTNLLVLYRESITKNGTYSKGFDLTALPDGEYYFELDKDVQIIIMPFTVAANQVVFSKEKEVIIYKPTVRVVDHKLFVSRLSFETQPMEVEIYYEAPFEEHTGLIFSEKIENTKIIERIYELSKQKKGAYTIIFKTQGRSFSKRLKF